MRAVKPDGVATVSAAPYKLEIAFSNSLQVGLYWIP